RAAYNVMIRKVHFVLDVAGLVPGVGEGADAGNGGIYMLEGDNTNAVLSFAAMVPIGGWVATAGRWARNALKFDGAGGWVSRSGLVFYHRGLSPDRPQLKHIFAFQRASNL
ncbi:MAG: hypothetical protein LH606_05650, partial [Cytophagaceae bacterium]|nr:hypothetical protein [Cytophagaceae bacterium]